MEICTGLGKGNLEHRAVATKLGWTTPETVGAFEVIVCEVTWSVLPKSFPKIKPTACDSKEVQGHGII